MRWKLATAAAYGLSGYLSVNGVRNILHPERAREAEAYVSITLNTCTHVAAVVPLG